MNNVFYKLPNVQIKANKLIILVAILIIGVSCKQTPSGKNNDKADLSSLNEAIRLHEEKNKTINKWSGKSAPSSTHDSVPVNEEPILLRTPSPIVPDGDSIYDIVEKMPEFPQALSGLYSYLKQEADNNYPQKAKKDNIQGRVIIQFVVEKDGSITDPRIMRSVHPLLDTVAVNIVKRMPKWQPGIHDKEYVRVRYTIPVMFKIAGKEPKVHIDPETGKEYLMSTED